MCLVLVPRIVLVLSQPSDAIDLVPSHLVSLAIFVKTLQGLGVLYVSV